jgi:hypothetical protein
LPWTEQLACERKKSCLALSPRKTHLARPITRARRGGQTGGWHPRLLRQQEALRWLFCQK